MIELGPPNKSLLLQSILKKVSFYSWPFFVSGLAKYLQERLVCVTMREFDALCSPSVKECSSDQTHSPENQSQPERVRAVPEYEFIDGPEMGAGC